MEQMNEKESDGAIFRRVLHNRPYLHIVLLIPLIGISILLSLYTTMWLVAIGFGMALGSPIALYVNQRTNRRSLHVAFATICGIVAGLLFINVGSSWLIAGLGLVIFPMFMALFALVWAEYGLIYYHLA
jgi:general stress protein CsbA